jgi:probable HAF family extracellular repeat protein
MTSVARGQTYTIMDLAPDSAFDETLAYGINQLGHVTGTGFIASTGELHALVFANGAIRDLGMLGFPYGADGVAINNSDQVAATGYGPGYHALLYSNSHVTVLGNLEGRSSEGLAINNLGHIVGRAMTEEGGYVGFTYIGGAFAAMAGGASRAVGINDSDQIVGSMGYYWTYGGYVHGVNHAFLYSGGTFTDLGSVGGGPHTDTEALGINNAGQVVGYSTAADGTKHAFLYSGSSMQDLGTIAPYYAFPVAINGSGMIVGNLQTYVGGPVGGFICANGVMSSLADHFDGSGAAWSDLTVSGLNDNGWIAGYGTYNGATHAFVAAPAPAAIARTHAFGVGCGQPALAIVPAANSRPLLSSTQLTVVSNVPGSAAFMAIGLSNAYLGAFPLPMLLDAYGLPGCVLYHDAIDPSESCVVTGPGSAQHSLFIPNNLALLDLPVYLQAWAPAPGLNAGGLILSNAMELRLGNF